MEHTMHSMREVIRFLVAYTITWTVALLFDTLFDSPGERCMISRIIDDVID